MAFTKSSIKKINIKKVHTSTLTGEGIISFLESLSLELLFHFILKGKKERNSVTATLSLIYSDVTKFKPTVHHVLVLHCITSYKNKVL